MRERQKQNGKKTNEAENPQKSGQKRRFWPIIIFFLAVISAATLYFIWLYFQNPSVSRNVRVTESFPAEKQPEIFERFEGKYFSFRHNAKYILKRHADNPDQSNVILENAFFSQDEINSKKIAVMVENMENKNMEDSASYHMRETFSQQYEKEKFQIENIQGTAFARSGGDFFEKVVFIPRGGYLAEIALTAPLSSKNDLEKEMEDIVKSIQWKVDF